ncbi:MAG: efflux RND transporter permease subunit [Flavobacteriaceae bacterium]
MVNRLLKYFLHHPLITSLLLLLFMGWGIITAPFDWNTRLLPRDPVPVDAIPDIGENQQIIFTPWAGRSPQDIEDQISYPLTTYLLGIPGVKSIRSSSIFGFSSVYVIFEESVEFYWSRSRILEKLNALPKGLLPDGVQPSLGPDATALGQVFWYTLEGRDPQGNPTGGWDLHEIRSLQDFYVKYALNAASGVAEVASIGGFVQEYQIDIDPRAMKAHQVTFPQILQAVQNSNKEVGAKTIEINQVEYLVRGLGYVKSIEDLEGTVVKISNHTPIRIRDLGRVKLGPSTRRGILDKDGAEVVGGVVVARYGANPLEVINNVKQQIENIRAGLPKKILPNGVESQLTIVPFYDRSDLIHETLGTLEEALTLEIFITVLVVLLTLLNLRVSILISTLLPIAVLITFIGMRYFGVDANIVALSGIAIAIGTMVDLAVILVENIVKHKREHPNQPLRQTIYAGASEVSGAIITAVSTTIVSFVPVFSMQAAEGKLFTPLAYTKTFALLAALGVTLFILPTLAHWIFGVKAPKKTLKKLLWVGLCALGVYALFSGNLLVGVLTLLYVCFQYFKPLILRLAIKRSWRIILFRYLDLALIVLGVMWLLAVYWIPLGPGNSKGKNFLFVFFTVGTIIAFFKCIEHYYGPLLRWCLAHKKSFLSLPVLLVLLAVNIWFGFSTVFGFVAKGMDTVGVNIRQTSLWSSFTHTFPGIGEEFMPALDEGSFLMMPTSMPHSGVDYNRKVLGQLDMLVSTIPEVELTVGKLGRVESALDPAPISMFENVILYKPEYALDNKGRRQRFKVTAKGHYITKTKDTLSRESILASKLDASNLIPDRSGQYFRNWRDHIQNIDDIWNEIIQLTKIPGVTSAPKLQPIETRLVMLQTGMRAPMGIKVFGPDLSTIEAFGIELAEELKKVAGVKPESVFAERIVGKPYLHLTIDRDKIARYGMSVAQVQQFIEIALGGMKISTTVQGRERFPIRLRYPRELRDSPEALMSTYLTTPNGASIPLKELVNLEYQKGPQAIKSEDTFLVGYVLFDKQAGFSEVEVVEAAQSYLGKRIDSQALKVPERVNFKFSGNYENQVRAEKRLALVIPLVLIIVFIILYFQFKSVLTSLMVFSGIVIAFSGGFLLLWLYGQSWFLDFNIGNTSFRDLFQVHPINLSVAVWVGFIALFGIATDDGVLMATYLDQSFKKQQIRNSHQLEAAVVQAGQRRIRPAIMTTTTTMIALLPILTSTGRGADIMIPMAIPAFGGMLIAVICYFTVPVLYAIREERKLNRQS